MPELKKIREFILRMQSAKNCIQGIKDYNKYMVTNFPKNSLSTIPDQLDGPRPYLERIHKSDFAIKCLAAFSEYVADSLKRRISACLHKLNEHAHEITYADEVVVEWPTGYFIYPSAEKMFEIIEALENGKYSLILGDKLALDQLIKALLNDTESHPDKMGGYKFSELVSILVLCLEESVASTLSKRIVT